MRRAITAAALFYVAAEFFFTPGIGLVQTHAQGAGGFNGGQTLQPGDSYPAQTEIPAKDVSVVDGMSKNRANINQRGEIYVTEPRAPGVKAAGGAATIGSSSALLLPVAAEGRRLLAIKNESTTASIAVCFGSCTAALNTAGSITIAPGQLLTFATTQAVPADAVSAIASASSTPATVIAW